MFSNFIEYSNRVAVYSEDNSFVTYAELDVMVNEFEELLDASELILILGSNDLETLVCYLASIRKGVVALMLPSNLDQTYLQHLLLIYKPKYVWSQKNSGVPIFPKTPEKYLSQKYTLHDSGINVNLPPSLALLLTTSGSTGNPKLVKISKENLEANTASILEVLDIEPEDRAITTMPISYSYGLSIINTHLQIGASLVMNNHSISSRDFWDYAKATKATSMGGVPFTYEMLGKFSSNFISKTNLRKFTQAGGKLKKERVLEILELIDELGGTFSIMYGQTEATARISVLTHELIKSNPESIGKAIPQGRILIYDENGQEVTTPFQVGELRYFGPNVSVGYADNLNDLYNPDSNNGQLNTGDLGYMDSNGLYFITGRKNRFIKLFGIRTNLDDIEGSLNQEGFNCVCHQKNDRLLIFTTEVDKVKSINDFVRGKFKLPRDGFSILRIETIPRNESGKILYNALLEEIEV
jgi:acyl-coenzyme A synthetase/AMP-(fatty) acid ligase